MNWLLLIALTVFGYLLGSVPTGIIVVRFFKGVDPRTAGSKNIGATNVGRTSGRAPGLLTLAGDILKGSIPPLLAIKLNGGPLTASLAGFSAFFGHLFPLFLNFRGGKGVATACGVFLVISPVSLILSLPVFVLLLLTTGYVSVGSIGAALAMPLYLYFLGMGPVYTVLGVVIGVLIIYTHRDNIKRIIKGEEIPFRASLSKDYRKEKF